MIIKPNAIPQNTAFRGPTAAVAFPAAISGVYDYKIPDRFAGIVTAGMPVLVEVRKRKVWGVALAVKNGSEYHELKEIIDIKEGRWADSSKTLLKLYEWMAKYYQCPMGRVFRPIVNKSVIDKGAKVVTVYKYNDVLWGRGDPPVTPPPKTDNPKTRMLKPITGDGVEIILSDNVKTNADADVSYPLSPIQRDAVDKIKSITEPLTAAELGARFGIKASTLTSLCKKGIIVKEKKTVLREADGFLARVDMEEIALSKEQQDCVSRVAASIGTPEKPFLLYGITGSGKTHVYVELTKTALSQGKGVIILVPEISLTPQTIMRFRAEIGDAITVIHSRMSDGERRDAMQEIVTGHRRAVIGVRSALLAPMDDVGLIIVDEEHDGSYKQSDTDPRYNARDTAVMRGKLQNAAVVLGSATPSLESYYNALTGKYHLLTLTERHGAAKLPDVKIADMTIEHSNKNWSALSLYLVKRMEEELAHKRQIILLLNRRGFSTSLLCRSCGYYHACPNCSVNMRYHKADTALKCHLCGYEEPAPNVCPKCGGEKIKYKGTGIQKAEEMIVERFPSARILRMDQDTTRRKGAHVAILEAFANGEADILLGTQMVAKGLNFPNVTLVGVLQADTGLYFPDFRASERTFQLLTQVAGRAGRAELPGEVVIQTYSPNEAAVRFSTQHDYLSFYAHEIENRKELSYPPFGKLARVVAEGAQEEVIRAFLHKSARMILSQNSDHAKIKILGPAPAVLSRVDNVYRYSMILKSKSPNALSNVLTEVRKMAAAEMPSSYRCIVDVDPVNMM